MGEVVGVLQQPRPRCAAAGRGARHVLLPHRHVPLLQLPPLGRVAHHDEADPLAVAAGGRVSRPVEHAAEHVVGHRVGPVEAAGRCGLDHLAEVHRLVSVFHAGHWPPISARSVSLSTTRTQLGKARPSSSSGSTQRTSRVSTPSACSSPSSRRHSYTAMTYAVSSPLAYRTRNSGPPNTPRSAVGS